MSDKQLTAEWFAARVGKVTASGLWCVLAVSKRDGRPLQARDDYLAEIVAERLTGQTYEHYVSAPMQWGTDTEPYAKAEYELRFDCRIEEAGFVEHPTISAAGASPDGYIDDDGLIEVKCPNTATHIKTRITGSIDEKYIAQMQWQLDCTGRDYCMFVSDDPRLPEQYQMWVKRVDRDEAFLADARQKVEAFLAEVNTTIERLKETV